MSELAVSVPLPAFTNTGGLPSTGDNVLYSTRAFVDRTSGRPLDVGPIQSSERNQRFVYGVFETDKVGTVKLMQWDRGSNSGAGGWVVVNNAGAGDATVANQPVVINYEIPPGDWQLVVNYSVAPTVYKRAQKLRLTYNQS